MSYLTLYINHPSNIKDLAMPINQTTDLAMPSFGYAKSAGPDHRVAFKYISYV